MNKRMECYLAEMRKYREDLSKPVIRRNELHSICSVILEDADKLIKENNFNPTPEEKADIEWARNFLKTED